MFLLDEEQLKGEICRVMRTLYARGLVSSLGGNVSGRFPGANTFWITPSGIFKGGVKPEHLIKVNLEGEVVGGDGKPSIETMMHAKIYRCRPDVNAVVHAHNPYTVGLTLAGVKLELVCAEIRKLTGGKVAQVPYMEPGSEELADAVSSKAMEGYNAIVLKGHGVVALASTLLEAEAIVESLEENSIVLTLSKILKAIG